MRITSFFASALLATLPLSAFGFDTLNCQTASQVARFSLSKHLIHNAMTDELAARAMDLYVEEVLKFQGVLSKEEIDLIKTEHELSSKNVVGSGLINGKCGFFESIQMAVEHAYQRLRAKMPDAETLALEILATASVPAAKTSVGPAADATELRARIIAQLARETAAWGKEVEQEVAARFVARRYLAQLDEFGVFTKRMAHPTMLLAFTLALDPHSVFHEPSHSEAWLGSFSGEGFIGVGLEFSGELTPYGPRIRSFVLGGPAGRSGQLAVGDLIIEVDGQPSAGLEFTEVEKLLRGPIGSKVTITAARLSNKRLENIRQVELVRQKIESRATALSVERKIVRGQQVVVVQLGNFYRNAAYDVAMALTDELNKGRVDAIVLDLRSNPGGVIDEAVKLTGLFIKTGPVLGVKSASGIRVERDESPLLLYGGPLVVAINNGSASASEIVAGSLKDLRRALVVGAPRSYGKGTVQVVFTRKREVPTGGALALTMAQFYTAGGASTQLTGVESHIVVHGPRGVSQDERSKPFALGSDKLAPFYHASELFSPPSGKPVAKLVKALTVSSKSRMAKGGAQVTAAQQLAEIVEIAADYARLDSRVRKGR